MRRQLLCKSTVIAAIVLSTPVAVGADLPFVGTWDCELKKFTFTETTYNNGSELLKIKKIKRHGKVYSLLMENGNSVSLFDIQKNKMTWHSLKNGDTFECKRYGTSTEETTEKEARQVSAGPRRIKLLEIAGRRDCLAQVRFDVLSDGEFSQNMEIGDMSGTMDDNALPLVMQPQFVGQATLQAACLTYIDGIPATIRSPFDEDINAGPIVVFGSNRM